MAKKKSKRPKKVTTRARSSRMKNCSKKVTRDPAIENQRMVIDVQGLQSIISEVNRHQRTCSRSDFKIVGNTWKYLKLKCSRCGDSYQVSKDNGGHILDINDALVIGAYTAGVGYSALKNIFNTMNSNFITSKTFQSAEERIGRELKAKWKEESRAVGQAEHALATEKQDVIAVDGNLHPFVSVVVDGGWPTRSYGHSYKSNAGVAVIVGARTRKVLYVDHRIKTCRTCMKNPEKDHECYQNWELSAQAMEADIIVNGFRESLKEHGLIYRYMIGDADSSVYARVQSSIAYPGPTPVEKVDCTNHAVRGLNSKLYALKKNTSYSKYERDFVSKNIQRYGKAAKCAIMYNQQNRNSANPTSSKSLFENILNIPAHIHGDHSKCQEYFCKGSLTNEFSEFKRTNIGKQVLNAFTRLANRSPRLIYDSTSNYAESFMSIMNKLVSGKRVNYAQRGSYANRTLAAAFEFNHGVFWPIKVFCSDDYCSSVWTKAYKEATAAKAANSSQKLKNRRSVTKSKLKPAQNNNEDYGEDVFQGFKSDEELELLIENLKENLTVTSTEQRKIERDTVGQTFNAQWIIQRRNRITASNAGKIFKLKDSTLNHSTLKSLLYPPDLRLNPNIQRGINQEPEARSLYMSLHDCEVEECGLFVYLENGIIAASPDGIIGTDGILEIKCINCPPLMEPKRKGSFLQYEKGSGQRNITLKRNHNYYYQIICQLYASQRNYCDFFVFHQPEDSEEPLYFEERILRSKDTDELWDKMVSKLVHFYNLDMAPEIVDPMFAKTMKFRLPQYRKDAINAKPKKSGRATAVSTAIL